MRLALGVVRSIVDIANDFDALTAADFDMFLVEARGLERLQALCQELLEVGRPEEAIGVMLRFIERVMAGDLRPPRFDFGSPGPLVHTLEKLPGYERSLYASLQRQPTPLTIWMLNRRLNITCQEAERERLLALLQGAATHPKASPFTREEAQYFIAYQTAPTDGTPTQ